jgi:hypothetical protein
MSSATGSLLRLLAALVIIAASHARTVRAQDIARLEAKVERLRARAAIVEAKADSAAASERAEWAGSLDTIRSGHLELLAPKGLHADAQLAAGIAWTALTEMFGDSATRLVDGKVYLVLPETLVDSAHSGLRWQGGLGTPILAPETNRVQGVAMSLVNSSYQEFWNVLDVGLRQWISAPLMPTLEPLKASNTTYIELATNGSPLTTDCFLGRLSACERALGLDLSTDRVTTSYSAPGRRALVEQLYQSTRLHGKPERVSQCVQGEDDLVCTELLHENIDLVPPPLSGTTRRTLLVTALQMGGSGSLTRLLAKPDQPITLRLQHAAGADEATLLARWRGSVMSTRPAGTQISSGMALSSVLWMTALVTLALRSSRWR